MEGFSVVYEYDHYINANIQPVWCILKKLFLAQYWFCLLGTNTNKNHVCVVFDWMTSAYTLITYFTPLSMLHVAES